LRPNPNYKSRGDEKSEARAEGVRGLREGRVRARLHRSRINRRLRVQAIRLKFTSDSLHTAYRFRVARRFGYGASPEMFRRCLERLDGEGIGGTLRILHALSDTKPVSTQGPVWYVGGRSV